MTPALRKALERIEELKDKCQASEDEIDVRMKEKFNLKEILSHVQSELKKVEDWYRDEKIEADGLRLKVSKLTSELEELKADSLMLIGFLRIAKELSN